MNSVPNLIKRFLLKTRDIAIHNQDLITAFGDKSHRLFAQPLRIKVKAQSQYFRRIYALNAGAIGWLLRTTHLPPLLPRDKAAQNQTAKRKPIEANQKPFDAAYLSVVCRALVVGDHDLFGFGFWSRFRLAWRRVNRCLR